MRRLAIPLTVLALLAAACGSSAQAPDLDPIGAPTADPVDAPTADPVDAPTPDPTATPTATPTPTDAPIAPPDPSEPPPSVDDPSHPFTADTRPDTNPGSGPLVTLTDLRAGQHEGYDRVVLDLGGGGQAGWRVEYVEHAIADGSGEPVPLKGGAVLQVLLDHTGMPDDTGVAFYQGPRRGQGPGGIREIVLTGMYEGTTQLFLGIDEVRPFRVFAVDGRVVIDVVSA